MSAGEKQQRTYEISKKKKKKEKKEKKNESRQKYIYCKCLHINMLFSALQLFY